ncbi:MAG: hydroxymethylpyrimidine/phosphomethylpyrimidine kinase [Deltaproteobacteria bacterium]|nr:hydroxymethylpyrimidine/phosphomethylpyrimidine kinase [Deltaproteobacteria bacterium]
MRVRTALCIGGSDSGGGAGIQADLKTFIDHGVYGMSVVTAVTAQDTLGIHAVEGVSPRMVRAQLEAVLGDLPVHAIKTGMLLDADTVNVVCEVLEAMPARPPVVVDPVLHSKDGTSLLSSPGALGRLFRLATVITPNLPEAGALAIPAGVPVLIKGGHAEGRVVEDRLLGAETRRVYQHRRVTTRNTHGTGCTLASAVAARLALGDELPEACRRAGRYVYSLVLRSRDSVGSGHGPLLHGLRSR